MFEEFVGKLPPNRPYEPEPPAVRKQVNFSGGSSGSGLFSVVCGLLDEARTFAAKNEELLIIAIIICSFSTAKTI